MAFLLLHNYMDFIENFEFSEWNNLKVLIKFFKGAILMF